VILQNLDRDYEEGMLYGMIGYYVPHSLYPAGYHCDPKQPLGFVCLGSQKNYMSLYMMPVYMDGDDWFQKAWAKTGKKLDMGKSCIRFRKADDLALDVISEVIRRMPAKKWIGVYESVLKNARTGKLSARRKSTKPAKSGAARGSGKAGKKMSKAKR
jgi:hypothetical protein